MDHYNALHRLAILRCLGGYPVEVADADLIQAQQWEFWWHQQ
jgi:hypothetical protein